MYDGFNNLLNSIALVFVIFCLIVAGAIGYEKFKKNFYPETTPIKAKAEPERVRVDPQFMKQEK